LNLSAEDKLKLAQEKETEAEVQKLEAVKQEKERKIEDAMQRVRDSESKFNALVQAIDNSAEGHTEKSRLEIQTAKLAVEEAHRFKDDVLAAAAEADRVLREKSKELERSQREAKEREEALLSEAQTNLPDMEQGREFFSMTTAAVLQKLEDQGIIEDARKLTWAFDLFEIAVLEGIPFHEWNDWILERVIQTKRKKDQELDEQRIREHKQRELEAKRVSALEVHLLNKTKSRLLPYATSYGGAPRVVSPPPNGVTPTITSTTATVVAPTLSLAATSPSDPLSVAALPTTAADGKKKDDGCIIS